MEWKNKPRLKQENQTYRENHRADERERVKQWRKAHPDKNREYKKLQHQKNPEAMIARKNRRRAREANTVATLTATEWKQILVDWNYSCAYCGRSLDTAHREHFIPLIKGGAFAKGNIVPACPTCNRKKRDQDPVEFISGLDNALSIWAKIQNYFTNQQ
jgi:5-methylcytosine-specific restriction endonuclease McrA